MTRARRPRSRARSIPDDPRELAATVDDAARGRARRRSATTRPKAIVVPHAGYVYSGPVAATAYATLAPRRDDDHDASSCSGPRTASRSTASRCRPPTRSHAARRRPVDADARAHRRHCPGVVVDDRPHAERTQPRGAAAVPAARARRVHARAARRRALRRRSTWPRVIDAVWGGPETLIVVSDRPLALRDARRATAPRPRTAAAILARRPSAIGPLRRVRRVPAARARLAPRTRAALDARAARPAHLRATPRAARSCRRLRRVRARSGRA